jgi:hypothetical protein
MQIDININEKFDLKDAEFIHIIELNNGCFVFQTSDCVVEERENVYGEDEEVVTQGFCHFYDEDGCNQLADDICAIFENGWDFSDWDGNDASAYIEYDYDIERSGGYHLYTVNELLRSEVSSNTIDLKNALISKLTKRR